MRLSGILTTLVSSVGVATAVPANITDVAIANMPQDDYHVWACEGVGYRVPCQALDAGGSGTCRRIFAGTAAEHAKSFILPTSNRFPAWECRFFTNQDCTGEDSCYLADTHPDSGCRYNYHSYWCIDDL